MAEDMETKWQATYWGTGSFFNEEYGKSLEAKTQAEAVEEAKRYIDTVGPRVFGFELREVYVPEPNPDPRVKVTGTTKSKTGTYFVGGTVYNLEQVESMGPDLSILASNMRGNRWPLVIKTRAGNWQPFKADDEYLVE